MFVGQITMGGFCGDRGTIDSSPVSDASASSSTARVPAPTILRIGAFTTVLQSLVAFAAAFWLIYRDLQTLGEDSPSLESAAPAADWIGTGTAVFIFFVFGTTLVGGLSLLRGRHWGRGPIVLLEFLLVFVAFYMFSGGAILAGVITAISVVLVLVGMFHRSSVEWFATSYGQRRTAPGA